LSLFGIVYLVDQYIPKPLPEPSGVHVGRTVVITGGNSGLGFEAARQLAVKYGVNVVLGCRSKSKCDAAAKLINDEVATSGISMQNKATPLLVDLADMQSVNSFVSLLGGIHVDVLFNNAGYVPDANLPVNKYGEFILLWSGTRRSLLGVIGNVAGAQRQFLYQIFGRHSHSRFAINMFFKRA
jgi:NAD(P)-dependent dehydrogenase (short-subunit alcohol dehydrogenase family)